MGSANVVCDFETSAGPNWEACCWRMLANKGT